MKTRLILLLLTINSLFASGQNLWVNINGKPCVGDTLSLTSNGQPSSIVWRLNNRPIDSVFSGWITNATNDTITFYKTVLAHGTYTATIIAANGDTATAYFLVHPIDSISISTTDSTTICPDRYVELSINNPDTTLSYLWRKDGSDILSAMAIDTLHANETGSYTVSATNIWGCTSISNVIPVYVYPARLDIIPSDHYPIIICVGDTITLTAVSDTLLLFHEWKFNGSPVPGNDSNIIAAYKTGLYSFHIIDQFGCSLNVQRNVTLTLDSCILTTSGFPPICSGGSGVNLEVTFISAIPAPTHFDIFYYQWFLNGDSLAATLDNKYLAVDSGTYSVTITDYPFGCINSSNKVNTDTIIHPLPDPVITQTGHTLCTETFKKYGWYRNGIPIPNALNQCYVPVSEGSYTVSVQDSNGCVNRSSPYEYKFALNTRNLSYEHDDVRIYPNPARNEINVVNVAHTTNSSIHIYDVSGRSVFHELLNFDHFNAKVHFNLAPGVYVVRFNDDSGVEHIERLVIY